MKRAHLSWNQTHKDFLVHSISEHARSEIESVNSLKDSNVYFERLVRRFITLLDTQVDEEFHPL
jgi:hypothetical protein